MEGDHRNIFECEAESLPFKYLCIQIHYKKLLNKERKAVVLNESGDASQGICYHTKISCSK